MFSFSFVRKRTDAFWPVKVYFHFTVTAEYMSTENGSTLDHISVPRLLEQEDLPPELPLLNSGNELIGRAFYQGAMGYSLHFEPAVRAKYEPSTLRSTKFIPSTGRPSALQIVMHDRPFEGI